MQDPAPTSRILTDEGSIEGKTRSTRDRPNRASFTNRSCARSFGKIPEQKRTRSASERSLTAEEVVNSNPAVYLDKGGSTAPRTAEPISPTWPTQVQWLRALRRNFETSLTQQARNN